MKAALRGLLSDEAYCIGKYVYVDIAVRIPPNMSDFFKELNFEKDRSRFANLAERFRGNLLDGFSKILSKLNIPHDLYPQKITKDKSMLSLVWRIKIPKNPLINSGINWRD